MDWGNKKTKQINESQCGFLFHYKSVAWDQGPAEQSVSDDKKLLHQTYYDILIVQSQLLEQLWLRSGYIYGT